MTTSYLAGRRGNKLGLALCGLCPVRPSACLVASLKYDLPRIILVGTGRRRQIRSARNRA